MTQSVKNPPANAGDLGLIPGSGRSPGGVHSNPLQYSCLENPMDRGAWQATVHGVAKLGHDLVTTPPPLLPRVEVIYVCCVYHKKFPATRQHMAMVAFFSGCSSSKDRRTPLTLFHISLYTSNWLPANSSEIFFFQRKYLM